MNFNKRLLQKEAQKNNYVRDTYEKVVRLVDILAYIRSIPFLFDNLALKGGTAINLTIFDLPRLSVDIDLDYTNNVSKEEMMETRKKINTLLVDYLEKNEYRLDRERRTHHALDSIKAYYKNAGGNTDSIKIEINYILRAHVYDPIIIKSKNYGLIKDIEIRTLDPIEIYGSKLVALMSRSTPRDLYDFFYMINSKRFNEEEIQKIKKCAVFYRAISNEDGNFTFDLSNLESITQNDIKRFLIPVINTKDFFSLSEAKQKITDYFNNYFLLDEQEQEFLFQFNEKKYMPELIYCGEELKNIKDHPMAKWKMRNR